MQAFSLLIKPASADCNLRCTYCFYLAKCRMYPLLEVHRMDNVALERTISSYMKTDQQIYTFAWQGGEPTLIGIDFFKYAVSIQNSCLKPGKQVTNGIQTNGTLLNDNWARFFSRNSFLVGVSLDGPEKVHNICRTSSNGKGSYSSVIRGIECLKRFKTEFNILTLVSQANVHNPLEIYRFLRDEMKCLYHQYIECVEFDQTGKQTEFSIKAQQWGDFLCTLFDEWINNDTNPVSVRLFDSIMSTLIKETPTLCSFSRDCRHYLVVEHNGDVYPCDFYVEENLKLGNITEDNWSTFLSSPTYEMFGNRKGHYDHECNNAHM